MNKKSFYIKGMHCASCVYTNEKALKAIPGVKDAVVNLATQKATLELLGDVSEDKIADAVKGVGYQAMFENESSSAEASADKEKKKE
ncbi:heavy-metal-associated domain-containing protein, partial [Patescibacteria group bacterium]|nr:heavy-metal-associated domain-containing protein [Patescibacteria group bacterium]